jgi:DNA-binding CsgD family transcriptional regulator
MPSSESAKKRRDRVVELRRQGLTNGEIADKLQLSERAVATLIYRAKQSGADVPRSPWWERNR